MTNKNLRFFFLTISFLALHAANGFAVDTLRPEDEDILWDLPSTNADNAKDVLYELSDGHYDEQGALIINHKQRVPSLGIPVQAIPVPQEINERAIEFDDPDILRANPRTPRSTAYPIGYERAAVNAPRLEPFDPNLTSLHRKSKEEKYREERIKAYHDAINDCMETQEKKLEMELGMLPQGDIRGNAAYLSHTFAEIEQCYDNIGLDIMDEFYARDNFALREYNRRTADFHVRSDAPSFNPKYCGETCSIGAVAELQMEKFGEFRTYLYQLLAEAPDCPETPQSDSVVVDETIFMQSPEDYVFAQEPREEYQPQSAPNALRIRQPSGNTEIVRQKPGNAPETTKNMPPAPIIEYDYDGVPLIDDAEL